MKNVSHKKGWNLGTNPAHVEPPLKTRIGETCNGKSDKDFVKIKLLRDTTSSMPDLCEFKMSLFGRGNPGKFMLFIRKFNMTLVETGMP